MTSSPKSLLNCLFTNACLNYSNGVLMHREKLNGNESGEWAKKKNLNSVSTSFSHAIISIEKKIHSCHWKDLHESSYITVWSSSKGPQQSCREQLKNS